MTVFTHALSTNNYGPAKFVVSSSAANGTHTTLASAMAVATSGDTIFLRDSVTENVTITPGVNIAAWDGGTLNVPTITGTLTMTGAGTSTISGLILTTNSTAIIAVTGGAASILNVDNCYLNISNNDGITFSSSSASAIINIRNCWGNLGTTGIKIFNHTSAGALNILYSRFANSGASVTASTASAGSLVFLFSSFLSVFTTSGTNAFGARIINVDTAGINTTPFTIGGSGTNAIYSSYISAGSASTISVSSTVIVNTTTLASTNTNNVTGAGTFAYASITWQNGNVFNPTTITRGVFDGGEYKGRTSNTAPAVSMIGEQIRATVSAGSPVSLSNATPANLTSISLTAGIWDVSAVGCINGTLTGTLLYLDINTTSATLSARYGDSQMSTPYMSTAITYNTLTVPSYRISLSSTTTVYAVMQCNFTVGTCTAFGRLSATRVA